MAPTKNRLHDACAAVIYSNRRCTGTAGTDPKGTYTMTIIILFFSLVSYTAALAVGIVADSSRTVGGLTFWRIGRVGGSFYAARR